MDFFELQEKKRRECGLSEDILLNTFTCVQLNETCMQYFEKMCTDFINGCVESK